jgi:hypothetical protein
MHRISEYIVATGKKLKMNWATSTSGARESDPPIHQMCLIQGSLELLEMCLIQGSLELLETSTSI